MAKEAVRTGGIQLSLIPKSPRPAVSQGVLARMAAVNRMTPKPNVSGMDPELAAIQIRNLEDCSGWLRSEAEKRTRQVRAGGTAAEIAQNGITRAREVRQTDGKHRPASNLEERLTDRNLSEAFWPNGEKGRPPCVPTESRAPEPLIYSQETTAAIEEFIERYRPPAELTSQAAEAWLEIEFSELDGHNF